MSVAVMGISQETAGIIASANQGVDDSFWTNSFNPISWFNSCHFSSSKSLNQIYTLENNPSLLSDENFGDYLHSFLDVKFAHEDFNAIGGRGVFGHILAGHEPDKVGKIGNRGTLKSKTIKMIKALYAVMKKRNGGKSNISLDNLLKILSNYVANNNGKGFIDVQKLVGGKSRNEKTKSKTVREQELKWYRRGGYLIESYSAEYN